MKRMTLILSVIAIFGLAACGGSQNAPVETPPGTTTEETAAADLTVEMHDIYYGDEANNMDSPPVWTVKAGEDVSVLLNNRGNLEHNWAIVEMGAEVPVPYTGGADQEALLYYAGQVVPAGRSETHTFTAPPEAGTYLVICTVSGHYPAMQGRLEVQ